MFTACFIGEFRMLWNWYSPFHFKLVYNNKSEWLSQLMKPAWMLVTHNVMWCHVASWITLLVSSWDPHNHRSCSSINLFHFKRYQEMPEGTELWDQTTSGSLWWRFILCVTRFVSLSTSQTSKRTRVAATCKRQQPFFPHGNIFPFLYHCQV